MNYPQEPPFDFVLDSLLGAKYIKEREADEACQRDAWSARYEEIEREVRTDMQNRRVGRRKW